MAQFKKGSTPWNKGKKLSDEHKRNLSKSHMGYQMPEEQKRKIGRKGEKHHNWKGGTMWHMAGYIQRLCPDHPFSGKFGYVFEHRLVMEAHLGRPLLPTERIHHINGIKSEISC